MIFCLVVVSLLLVLFICLLVLSVEDGKRHVQRADDNYREYLEVQRMLSDKRAEVETLNRRNAILLRAESGLRRIIEADRRRIRVCSELHNGESLAVIGVRPSPSFSVGDRVRAREGVSCREMFGDMVVLSYDESGLVAAKANSGRRAFICHFHDSDLESIATEPEQADGEQESGDSEPESGSESKDSSDDDEDRRKKRGGSEVYDGPMLDNVPDVSVFI